MCARGRDEEFGFDGCTWEHVEKKKTTKTPRRHAQAGLVGRGSEVWSDEGSMELVL